jgi:hypothetical protein
MLPRPVQFLVLFPESLEIPQLFLDGGILLLDGPVLGLQFLAGLGAFLLSFGAFLLGLSLPPLLVDLLSEHEQKAEAWVWLSQITDDPAKKQQIENQLKPLVDQELRAQQQDAKKRVNDLEKKLADGKTALKEAEEKR